MANEREAAMRAAELVYAAAKSAPLACEVDEIQALILENGDKDALAAALRENEAELELGFFARDAELVDGSYCVVLVGSGINPRGMYCKLCGFKDCSRAGDEGVYCTLSVRDLQVAVGKAMATPSGPGITKKTMYSAGMVALKHNLFPGNIKMCFGVCVMPAAGPPGGHLPEPLDFPA